MNPFFVPPLRRSWSNGAAFTLIELLVVISIIALLAGLLLPVVSKVTEKARQTSCKNTETQIVAAVNNYQTDYGQYPVVPPASPGDTTIGTDSHNVVLFNVLRALNGGDPTTGSLNSRNTVYFENKNVKSSTAPKDGFIQVEGVKNPAGKAMHAGDLVDPWGYAYFIRIDSDYSNAVENPYVSNNATDSDNKNSSGANDATVLRFGAISYSFGSDAVPGTTGHPPAPPYTSIGDDVVSWQ